MIKKKANSSKKKRNLFKQPFLMVCGPNSCMDTCNSNIFDGCDEDDDSCLSHYTCSTPEPIVVACNKPESPPPPDPNRRISLCEFPCFSSDPLQICKSSSEDEDECKPVKIVQRTDQTDVLNYFQFKKFGDPKDIDLTCCGPPPPIIKLKNSRCEFQSFRNNPIKLVDPCPFEFANDITGPPSSNNQNKKGCPPPPLKTDCNYGPHRGNCRSMYNCRPKKLIPDDWPHLTRPIFERHTDVKCTPATINGQVYNCHIKPDVEKELTLADYRCMNDDGILIALQKEPRSVCNIRIPDSLPGSFHKGRKNIRFLSPYSRNEDPSVWNNNGSNSFELKGLKDLSPHKYCCKQKNFNVECNKGYFHSQHVLKKEFLNISLPQYIQSQRWNC